MHDEKPLTGEDSLAIITAMINKAKCEYHDTGISCLLWGSVVTVCSLVTFANYWLKIDVLGYVWFLTVAAVVVQVIISMNEAKTKKFTSYTDSAMGGVWISFGIAIFMFSFYTSKFAVPHANAIFLISYGVPTFTTGFMRNFKPMLIGGIVCWALAIAGMYTLHPYTQLYAALAAQVAWFIPGLILRKRYLEAKRGNV